jgi:hypothetical protein
MLIRSQDGERLVKFGPGNYLVINRIRGRKLSDPTRFSIDCWMGKDFFIKLADFENEEDAKNYLSAIFDAHYNDYKVFEG